MGIALEVEDLGVRCQIDQMGAAVQHHVREKVGVVNLTSLGAGNSNANWNLIFHQVGEIIIGAVPGFCFNGHIPFDIC